MYQFLLPIFTRPLQAIPKKPRHKLATTNTFELTTAERLALPCNNAPLGCANHNFFRTLAIPHIHNILTNRSLSVMYSRMNLLGMIVKHLRPNLPLTAFKIHTKTSTDRMWRNPRMRFHSLVGYDVRF